MTVSDIILSPACSCNQHARRCRFNSELFRLSGGRSGGVCERCRHHTAGRHCHYCQPGFWRDPSQPITSHKACRGECGRKPSQRGKDTARILYWQTDTEVGVREEASCSGLGDGSQTVGSLLVPNSSFLLSRSLPVPPNWSNRRDVQPDQWPVLLQARGHRPHMQSLWSWIPAESLTQDALPT